MAIVTIEPEVLKMIGVIKRKYRIIHTRAKKDLKCSKCGKLMSKGSKCYITNLQELICPICRPETKEKKPSEELSK